VLVPHKTSHNRRLRGPSSVWPITDFWVHGVQGVRLLDALKGDLTGLESCDSEVMHAPSAKVTYKIDASSV
jgi:hypothetical protein